MRRRDFIALIGSATLCPLAARAHITTLVAIDFGGRLADIQIAPNLAHLTPLARGGVKACQHQSLTVRAGSGARQAVKSREPALGNEQGASSGATTLVAPTCAALAMLTRLTPRLGGW